MANKLTDLGLSNDEAERVQHSLQLSSRGSEQVLQVWTEITRTILKKDHDFELHKLIYSLVFSSWDVKTKGPAPSWVPNKREIAKTNLVQLMTELQGNEIWERRASGDVAQDYQLLQKLSCTEIELIWPLLLQKLKITYARRPPRILAPAIAPDDVRWLPGARMNIAACALCNRDPDNMAIVFAEEDTPQEVRRLTLGQLKDRCFAVASSIRSIKGYAAGMAVAICMPMTVHAVIIYLGVVLAGCVVVGIADSFSAAEIATRVEIGQAKIIFTQDVISRDGKVLPLFERVVKKCSACAVVLPGTSDDDLQVPLRDGDMSWQEFLNTGAGCEADQTAHMADANDITNILFSSGTTGTPKAIPWTHVTPIRGGLDAWAQMDVKEGDTVAFPTNLGWMMGPWLIYAALLNGASIALYHGSPLGRAFGEFVESAGVTTLGTVPSIVRAWRKTNCMRGLDWSKIRNFASTGEASSPDDSLWLQIQAGYKPVIELCGGTEIGGGFLAGSMLQPQCPSTFSTPTLGSNLVILHGDDGSQQQSSHLSGEVLMGELTLVPPFLGASQRLLNADHHKVYYEGMPVVEGGSGPLRRHGDIFERLPGGYYCAHGRSDDSMNLGGIKVSSVELERACLNALPGTFSEAAAIAVPEAGGGPDRLVVFVVPKNSSDSIDLPSVTKQCQQAIRAELNPLFKLHQVIVVENLPRTATNKVMRRELRSQLASKARL